MSSKPTPPDDDGWAPPADQPGRWEGEDAAGQAGRTGVGGSLSASARTLWDDPRGRPLVLVSGLALFGVCALSCFILSLVFLSDRGGVLFEPGPGPQLAPTVAAISDTLDIRVNETPIPVAVPDRLNLGTNTFRVVPMAFKDGRWDYDAGAANTAYWVPGTLVNHVVGLHASNENKQVVDALRPDDLITLDTSLGTQRYRVVQQATVRDTDLAELAEQTSPRLTLVMMGEGGGQRRVVLAQYTDESTPNELSSVGSAVNLGDVRVMALDQRLIPGRAAGLPAGKNYLQVEFQVTNLLTDTTKVLDAAQFFSELTDAGGTVFQLSESGSSASGATGFTKGALQPGQTITATAGFEVPSELQGPSLEWTFRSDKSTPYIARVAIPYRPVLAEATAAPTRSPTADVNILAANVAPGGNEIRIVGTVRNLTNTFLPASLQEVTMSGPGGQFVPLNSALPAFPWNITPGETLAFQLSFARPQGPGPYVFSVFGRTFEISGL